jgi:hypothetical protein
LLAAILVVVLVQFAPSVSNAASTTIVACADKKTGDLRIAYKKCTGNENNVSWGITGPKGATGAKGATGLQGLQGLQGSKGDRGDQGEQGEQGLQGDAGETGDSFIKAFGEVNFSGQTVPQKTTANVTVVKGGPWLYYVEVDGIDTSECTISVTNTQIYAERSIAATPLSSESNIFNIVVINHVGGSPQDFSFNFLVTCIN